MAARNLEIGSTRNWAKTVVNWNLALDPSGGPHVGGCGTCTGIVTVGPGDTVTPNAEYYALGQLSRFVQPGAVRIASTSFGTTGWNGQIMDVAFVNPDGSTVLVAHNENDNPQSFSVSENGQSFNYALPGDSLATFVWARPPGPAGGLRELSPSGWQATAVPAGPADPCCSGDVAGNAVDDDASTRYSTGTAQALASTCRSTLGQRRAGDQIRADPGASTGDYAGWVFGDGQPERHGLERTGGDRGRIGPAHHHQPGRQAGPLRPGHADRVQRQLVERRRRPGVRPGPSPVTGERRRRSALRPGALPANREPPWGDREWIERGEQRDAPGESLFKSWPLLVPQLAGIWPADPLTRAVSQPTRRAGHPPGREPGSAFSNTRSQATFTPTNTTAVSSTAATRSGAIGKLSWPTMCG